MSRKGSDNFSTVTVVCELDSWIKPFAHLLSDKLKKAKVNSTVVFDYSDVKLGDAAIFFGCTRVCPANILKRNEYNLVVHESALPKGRGFAPLSWSILEGQNELIFSLIEATKDLDSGKIYDQIIVPLKGYELCDELRKIQGTYSIKICFDFIINGGPKKVIDQVGKATYYRRRTPKDSELSINKTIIEQFDLLRTVDNERYPAFFKYKGRKFKIMIEDAGSSNDE